MHIQISYNLLKLNQNGGFSCFFNHLIYNYLCFKFRIIKKRLGIVANNITFALPF